MDAEQVEFWKKCKASCVFFATAKWQDKPLVYLKHTSKGRIPLHESIYDWQIDVLERLQGGQNLIVNKSRRVGVSWTCVVFVTWLIEFHRDLEILLLSRGEKYAKNLLRKLKFCDKNLPIWMRREVGTDSKERYSLVSRNDKGEVVGEAVVDSLTTTGGSGRGEGARFVLADELAWMAEHEEVWSAIVPTTADGGQIVAASTPCGMENTHHRVFVEAMQNPTAEFVALEIHYSQCGHGQDWLAKASKGMTDVQISQEFELEFLVTGVPAFNPTAVKACYMPPDQFPEVQKMIEESKKFFLGIDSAEGKTHRRSKSLLPDYNSACVINELGIQVHAEHNREPLTRWAGETVREPGGDIEYPGRVSEIHAEFPGKMAIERNGPGLIVADRHILPDDGVSEIALRTMTAKLKPRLVHQLSYAFENKDIIITDYYTYQCCLVYQIVSSGISGTVRFEAPSGYYDDPVVSLMLAFDLALEEGMYEFDWGDVYASGRRLSTKPPSEREDPIPLPDKISVPKESGYSSPRTHLGSRQRYDPWSRKTLSQYRR